jgi:hypothetical protein
VRALEPLQVALLREGLVLGPNREPTDEEEAELARMVERGVVATRHERAAGHSVQIWSVTDLGRLALRVALPSPPVLP